MSKKIVFLILALVLIIPSIVYSATVTRTTAEQVAMNWYSERNDKAPNDFEIVESFIEKENTENIFFIFNFDKTGFVMVSADDAAIPILGYVFEHNYTLENHPPQFDAMLASFKEQIVYAKENSLSASQEAQDEWERLNVRIENFERNRDFNRLDPLLSSLWNQSYSWNTYCPPDGSGPGGYVYAGCVAVAMAQIMNYWGYPTTGTGSHSYSCPPYGTLSANFGATTYNFPMNNTTPDNDIRELLYHCGVSVDMQYGPTGSGAYTSDVVSALETYFDYDTSANYDYKSSYTNTVWENMIRSNLDDGYPLQYRGSGTGGHSFNLDGYENSDISHFHFNWGWSGSYNGYYYLNDLTPGSYNFTNDQAAIFDIFPASGAPGIPTTPNPTNGSTGISIDTMISWVNGANTDDVDVYFSSNQTLVTNKDASVRIYSGTAISTIDPSDVGSLDYNTTYYWRIVCKNSADAETDGPVWSFTTGSSGGTPATLSYHNSTPAFFWHCPDQYGDYEFGVRYTPADACDLDSVSVCFYSTTGSPTGITIHVYDVDYGTNPSGLPNVELGSYPVSIANINLYPAWTIVDLRSLNLSFTSGEEFFITYTVDGGVYGVTEVHILSDDGSSIAYRSVENYGSWGYMLDDWGGDYQFFMSAHIWYSAAIPPTLVINPVSIDFQRTAIGGWKTQTVTLENVGGGQVVINSVSIAGDPQIELYDYNTYPDTLFNNESIDFMVAYGPDAVETNSATITVSETSTRTDHFIPINGEGYIHNSWASGSPVFNQPPTGNQGDYGWSMGTSDAAPGYLLAGNFWSIPQPITAVEYWGINWYHDGTNWVESGVEDPMTFEIKFYSDHATEYSPDVEVASFSIPLSRTTVDTVTFGGGPVYKYRAELPTSVVLTDGWVSIRGTSVSSPIDPWFLWSESPIGDHGNVTYNSGSSTWDFDEVDLAFALYTNALLPPADVVVSISGTNAIVSWTPEDGRNYNVYSDSDPYGSFSTLAGTVTDGSGTFTEPVGVDEKRFYRVTTATFQRESIKVAPALHKSKFIRSIEDSFLMDGNELKK